MLVDTKLKTGIIVKPGIFIKKGSSLIIDVKISDKIKI
jgi:hypothetical protein